MQFKDIIYEKREGIAVATFNRPDALNAFRNGMLHEFKQILEDVSRDETIRVLILTGEGRAFSAGRDLKDLAFLYEAASSSDKLRQEVQLVASITKQLSRIPKVVIAAINGLATGIGVEFALACDIRMASEQAFFGFPEVKRALFVTNGVMYFLSKIVGLGRIKADGAGDAEQGRFGKVALGLHDVKHETRAFYAGFAGKGLVRECSVARFLFRKVVAQVRAVVGILVNDGHGQFLPYH